MVSEKHRDKAMVLLHQGADADTIAAALADAEAAAWEAAATELERQNQMLNDLLGGDLHDAFVSDIGTAFRKKAAAVRQGGSNRG